MTTPITDHWIAEHEAICAKASKGPWQPEAMFDRAHPEYIFPQYVTGRFDGPDWRKNFDFIASARTALPLALAELRRLREVLSRLYPGMMGSGMCSKHPSADAVLSCSICFPNWNDLCSAHCELKQLAWDRLRELGEPIPGIDTALAARERGE